MATVAKLGMRGTGDWGTDVRPKNFREMILLLFPNGAAPLTAVPTLLGASTTSCAATKMPQALPRYPIALPFLGLPSYSLPGQGCPV